VTPLGWGLLALAAAAAVVDWWAVWTATRSARTVERVAKPAVLAALVVLAAVAPTVVPSVQGWLAVALVCCLIGDILLLPPGRLAAGLVAFLVGHLAYTGAFAQLSGSAAWALVGVAGAVLVAMTVGRRLVRAADGRRMAVPVALYLLVICVMAIAATRTGMPAAILGAWLFVASDTMLGWGEFVVTEQTSRDGRRLRLAVIASYHVAQVLLVLALLFGS
jgi:uncharacterized membrane protein YhhN